MASQSSQLFDWINQLFISLSKAWDWFITPLFTLDFSWAPVDFLKNIHYEISPLFLVSFIGLSLTLVVIIVKLFFKWF